jgi:hypothetical protein
MLAAAKAGESFDVPLRCAMNYLPDFPLVVLLGLVGAGLTTTRD